MHSMLTRDKKLMVDIKVHTILIRYPAVLLAEEKTHYMFHKIAHTHYLVKLEAEVFVSFCGQFKDNGCQIL